VGVNIGHLPPGYLGLAFPGAIWIDQTAAGFGWSIGAGPAAGRMDLLTVVAHELGHELGLGDINADDDVMGEALAAGVRRVPAAADLAPGHAANPAWWLASGTGAGPQLRNAWTAPPAGGTDTRPSPPAGRPREQFPAVQPADGSTLNPALLSEVLLSSQRATTMPTGEGGRPQDLPSRVPTVTMPAPGQGVEGQPTPWAVPITSAPPGELSVVAIDRLFAHADGSQFSLALGEDPLSVHCD
jgi:hypothetical protein